MKQSEVYQLHQNIQYHRRFNKHFTEVRVFPKRRKV